MSQHCPTCRNMSLEFSYPFIAGASTFLILFRHPFFGCGSWIFSTVEGLESHSSRHGTDMVPPTFHEVNPKKWSHTMTHFDHDTHAVPLIIPKFTNKTSANGRYLDNQNTYWGVPRMRVPPVIIHKTKHFAHFGDPP